MIYSTYSIIRRNCGDGQEKSQGDKYCIYKLFSAGEIPRLYFIQDPTPSPLFAASLNLAQH